MKKAGLGANGDNRMNTVKNDYGQWVIAIGAPGSMERIKIERPAAIEWVNSIIWQQLAYAPPSPCKALIVEDCKNHWDIDTQTAKAVVECSDFEKIM